MNTQCSFFPLVNILNCIFTVLEMFCILKWVAYLRTFFALRILYLSEIWNFQNINVVSYKIFYLAFTCLLTFCLFTFVSYCCYISYCLSPVLFHFAEGWHFPRNSPFFFWSGPARLILSITREKTGQWWWPLQ